MTIKDDDNQHDDNQPKFLRQREQPLSPLENGGIGRVPFRERTDGSRHHHGTHTFAHSALKGVRGHNAAQHLLDDEECRHHQEFHDHHDGHEDRIDLHFDDQKRKLQENEPPPSHNPTHPDHDALHPHLVLR